MLLLLLWRRSGTAVIAVVVLEQALCGCMLVLLLVGVRAAEEGRQAHVGWGWRRSPSSQTQHTRRGACGWLG